MGKNCDRVSIIAAILESANVGSSKTHIMFGANLSFSLLEKYLCVAVDSGFLRFGDAKYHLTDLKYEYLKQYWVFEAHYTGAQKVLEGLICERERLAQFGYISKEHAFEKELVKRNLKLGVPLEYSSALY